MIVGVGGQGTLLASRVLGNVALKKDYDVKMSEVHGMAQRGGSVVTYVKLGKKVYSPVIEKGEADIIIAFEQLEALRWIDYLKDGGRLVVNEQKINPMPVIIGKAKYPSSIIEKLKENFSNVIAVDALKIAKECGNIKALNTVLLGFLAKSMNVEKDIWIESLKETVPAKALDVNMKAFESAYNSIS
jgi:indolepyruvate ferredoxin oxidoreductase beta subunit